MDQVAQSKSNQGFIKRCWLKFYSGKYKNNMLCKQLNTRKKQPTEVIKVPYIGSNQIKYRHHIAKAIKIS